MKVVGTSTSKGDFISFKVLVTGCLLREGVCYRKGVHVGHRTKMVASSRGSSFYLVMELLVEGAWKVLEQGFVSRGHVVSKASSEIDQSRLSTISEHHPSYFQCPFRQ